MTQILLQTKTGLKPPETVTSVFAMELYLPIINQMDDQ